ncbi:MAG: Vi polysaccharide biosynthesis protein VipA/TviB [Candidatus Marinimicrobia bacterium]|nr:Vi polysaccharide biosynthesis protein VipA/TviB [Candidatus Neomarinimicrobiota bacterium]
MLKLNGKIKIGVVGLGYVGLPLAIELSKKYFTIGFDTDQLRINDLIKSNDKTLEISQNALNKSSLKFTQALEDISDCDIYIVTVPTPVDKNNNPDFSPIKNATNSLGQVLEKNNIVIYESTVYPGATEGICVPILEKVSGLKYNSEFYCGYSPERINPGDKKRTLKKITKIVSGSTDECADFIDQLYTSIIPAGTHKVSSISVAEAAKVIENIQRDVNIALINELAIIFNKIDLDTKEVLEAAGTKWNFLPFQPGLVGGHCIGVDPYYLTHRAAEIGYHPEIILAGRRINDGMAKYVSDLTIKEMTRKGINPVDAKVAVLGLTFKENCPDTRNTKSVNIIENLLKYDCDVVVSDPYADISEAKERFNIEIKNLDTLEGINAVVLCVAHSEYENINLKSWKKLFSSKGVFIDVKSVYNKGFFSNSDISHWRL